MSRGTTCARIYGIVKVSIGYVRDKTVTDAGGEKKEAGQQPDTQFG